MIQSRNLSLQALLMACSAAALLAVQTARAADAVPAPGAGDYVHGVKLWATECARCHNMRDPKEFTDKQWKVIVTHMKVRGTISGADARDILTFLQGSN